MQFYQPLSKNSEFNILCHLLTSSGLHSDLITFSRVLQHLLTHKTDASSEFEGISPLMSTVENFLKENK